MHHRLLIVSFVLVGCLTGETSSQPDPPDPGFLPSPFNSQPDPPDPEFTRRSYNSQPDPPDPEFLPRRFNSQPDPPDPGFALVSDTEPARHCHDSSQCKADERCYKPNTPIGVCVPRKKRMGRPRRFQPEPVPSPGFFSRRFNSQPDPPDPGFLAPPSDTNPPRFCKDSSQCKANEECVTSDTPVGICVVRSRRFNSQPDPPDPEFFPRRFNLQPVPVPTTGLHPRRYNSQPDPPDPEFVGNTFFIHFTDQPCLVDSQCPAHQVCSKPFPNQSGKCVPQGLPPGNKRFNSQPDPPDPGFALVSDTEPARHCHDSTQCKADERCYKPNTPIGVCVPKSRKFNSQPDPPDPGFARRSYNSQPDPPDPGFAFAAFPRRRWFY